MAEDYYKLEEIVEINKKRFFPKPDLLDLLIFGVGSTVGMVDGLIYPNDPTNIDFYALGLFFSLPAFLVSYGFSNNLKKSIEYGSKCQISYLFGRILIHTIKNTFS